MAEVDFTQYAVNFRAPALPIPPQEYNKAAFDRFNNTLRLYFNQLDDALRNDTLAEKSDALSWYLS
jgi:hypothetical protein